MSPSEKISKYEKKRDALNTAFYGEELGILSGV
jgi:hypothetical protein